MWEEVAGWGKGASLKLVTLRAFSVVEHYKMVGEVKMNVRSSVSILLV